MNTTAKGRRVSTLARHWAEERGCLVYTVPHTRFSKDAFGVADQVWILGPETEIDDDDEIGILLSKIIKTLWLVQVKAGQQWGSLKKYREFSRVYPIIIMKYHKAAWQFKVFRDGVEA